MRFAVLSLVLAFGCCGDDGVTPDAGPTCRPTDDAAMKAACDAAYEPDDLIPFVCDPGAPHAGPGYESCWISGYPEITLMCCKS